MNEVLRPLQELGPLRDPVLITAFGGWGDQGGAAVATLAYLTEQWHAKPLADIDPEPFYDFTVRRPQVRNEGGERVLDWPETCFYVAQRPGVERDFVLLVGPEPGLHWKAMIEVIEQFMRTVGVTTSITLGARGAAVPHTRPTAVMLSASDAEFESMFELKAVAPTYEGPTSFGGVMNLHHRSLGWRNASLSAIVPHYLNFGPDPNAALALIGRLDRAFGTSTPLRLLNDCLEVFAAQVDKAMSENPDAAEYVRELERQHDDNPQLPPPADQELAPGADPNLSATEVLDDLERFLRDERERGEAA